MITALAIQFVINDTQAGGSPQASTESLHRAEAAPFRADDPRQLSPFSKDIWPYTDYLHEASTSESRGSKLTVF